MKWLITLAFGLLMLGTLRVSPTAQASPSARRPSPPADGLAKATFAGGCFWCMERPFDQLRGVVSATSGYIGGNTRNPTYEEVSAGGTGHAEAVQVVYDPERIGYSKLLDVFWRSRSRWSK